MNGFSGWLRTECAGAWRAAHETHPFVQAISDGTLPLDKFQYFMRQDYLFLRDYCRVIALAAAKSPDLESMSRWAGLLDETLNSEMALHRSFCSDFGISEEELASTETMPATAAYTDHLLRTAYEGDSVSIAVAILPCQWGYDEIGRMLEEEITAPPDSFHARWAAGYAVPEYRDLTVWLRRFIDEAASDLTQDRRDQLLQIFQAGIQYEFLFWEAAWTLQEWPK